MLALKFSEAAFQAFGGQVLTALSVEVGKSLVPLRLEVDAGVRQITPEERQARWQAYQSLSPEERNKLAERVVFTESDTLVALYSLSMVSTAENASLRAAIRAYASAVVEEEWPLLALEQRSPRTDAALNALLREVARPGSGTEGSVQRTMLDMVLQIRAAHEDRVALANDRTVVTKWAAVLLLAFLTQVSIAAVHLEKPRPQAAALAIFTVAAVLLLGLLAIHEAPFEPPVFVPPGPISDVLRKVPP